MLQVWLRGQHTDIAVWHADTQLWQLLDSWQALYDTYYGHYKSNSAKTLCIYFPSSYALQVDTALSSAQLKQLGTSGKQYLFDESSLTPSDQLLVRQIGDNNSHYLYALAQNDIEAWQQSAALVGLTISALIPDFLLLPPPEEGAGQQVVLYQDKQTTLLRQSLYQGLAVSYLPLIVERLPHLSEVLVLPAIDGVNTINTAAEVLADRALSTDLPTSVKDTPNIQKTADAETDRIADIDALLTESQIVITPLVAVPTPIDNPERHALNFFTKSSDSKLSPYLQVAMMVALSALVLQIATDSVQWYRYHEATAATKTQIAAQYNTWFVNEPLNPRTNLQNQIQPKLITDRQASSAHMSALGRISPLLKQSDLQAQSLSMQPSSLSFTLIAADRSSLDQFANTLNEQGMSANLERVNNNEQGQFSGQITVEIADNSTDGSLAASS